MKNLRKHFNIGLMTAGIVAFSAIQAPAVPILQLYIEGATYDTASETWVADFSSGDTLRLWTIGNVAGSGGKGTIFDVNLAIAYAISDTPTISIVQSTTGGYMGFTDPSLANAATFSQMVTDGSIPLMGDGTPLSSHGVYGASTAWSEYSLGDFSRTDAMGGDFINALPSPPSGGYDINVYNITITGTDIVHFDLYDHTEAVNRGLGSTNSSYWFAPYSHDAEGNGVPDGGSTLALLGIALVGAGVAVRKAGLKSEK
jgi:hypothetical protein